MPDRMFYSRIKKIIRKCTVEVISFSFLIRNSHLIFTVTNCSET